MRLQQHVRRARRTLMREPNGSCAGPRRHHQGGDRRDDEDHQCRYRSPAIAREVGHERQQRPQLAARRRFGRGGLVRRLDWSAGRRAASLDDVHLTRPLLLRPYRTKAARHCPAGPQVAIGRGQICSPEHAHADADFRTRLRLGEPEPGSGERIEQHTDVHNVSAVRCEPARRRPRLSACVAGPPASGPNRFCGHRMTQHGQMTVARGRGGLAGFPPGARRGPGQRRAYALFRRAARVIEPRLLIDLEHARARRAGRAP